LNDFDYGQYWDPSGSQVCQAITGTLSKGTKNIQYLGINDFMLRVGYYDAGYSLRPIRPVLKNFFSAIRQPGCDGFILDLRNNRGGNLEDIDFLVGQLTTNPLLFGYMRYKSGPGRLDYTPDIAMNVTPQPGAADFKTKIVILTDAYTASLSEKVIMAFKALPSATVVTIGATTYGSCGLLSADGIATNSGSFAMASFGSVQLSNMAVEDTKHQFTMGGIVPDVKVAYDSTGVAQMLKTGVDVQMEAAIRYLNQ
ncbi:MAG TPA: S41 family peptidase, partial [Puia sp.]|nr:S41 family peptidase [Puia sp.]